MVTRAAGIRFRWGIIIFLFAAAVAAAMMVALDPGPEPKLQIQADRDELPAGGASAHLTVRSSVPLWASGMQATITGGAHSARIARTYFDDGVWHVTVQSLALPGKVTVAVRMTRFQVAVTSLRVAANFRDSAGDGTPDVLRLEHPADQQVFRKWFTFLAEAQFFRETRALPAEISDCAGLIRYAYREALRSHAGDWAGTSGLPLVPAIGSIRKYEYPFTPWGAALFRTGPDPGALGEFADAGTLLKYNTHLVSHDIRQARPGDLLFFHQEGGTMPFHSMIYLGASQIENAAGPFVIYHTGPAEAGLRHDPGEIRRPSVDEMQKHPDPAWHFTAENPHYLGVYRWNILRY
jgi:uncharacterized protein YfaT (DUF1175 family)